jgi:hypothetical protein
VRRQIEHQPAFGAQAKVHRERSQRAAQHGVDDVRRLGRLALDELEPRRNVAEQVAHLDLRAHRGAGRAPFAGHAALHH